MKTKKNQPESFEEIIFKNRNKAYGAFLLRKSYSRTVTVAAIITLFVFSFLVSWAVWNVRSAGPVVTHNWGITVDSTHFIKPVTPPILPVDKELPPPDRKLFKPVVVDSAVDNELVTQGELETSGNDALTTTENLGTRDSVVIEKEIIPVPDPDKVEVFVQEFPEFPGGDAERVKFLKENLTYPPDAREVGTTGTVYLEFIVERDGSISNIRVKRGIGGGCDEEAIRVVKLMPKWKPGRQQGHEVRVQFILPIKFTLH